MSARSAGPGSHDIPLFPDKSPSSRLASSGAFSFGSGQRDSSLAMRRRGLGPGGHHPKFNLTERRHSGHGFGKQRRFSATGPCKARDTPAPALEQGDNQNFKRPPRYSFGTTEIGLNLDERGKPPRGVREPGPGDHNPDDRCSSMVKSTPAYSATPRRGAEEPVKKDKGPGPGSYDFEAVEKTKQAAPSMVFGSSARNAAASDAERRGNVKPGPGHYGVTNKTRTGHNSLGMGGSSPGFSMGRRINDNSHLNWL